MRARDIMTREVITVGPNATVQDAARVLADYHISGVPVLDESGRLVGILTEADIISKEGERVADILTPRVVSVREDTFADEVARVLTSLRIKRVPVLRDGHVVGIVSRADIVRMIASRWVCPVCGAIQHSNMPEKCYACGSNAADFEHDMEPRTQITLRQ